MCSMPTVPKLISVLLCCIHTLDQEGAERSKGGSYSSWQHAKEVPDIWSDNPGNSRANVCKFVMIFSESIYPCDSISVFPENDPLFFMPQFSC
jgi:hypothetical protein